MKIVDEVFPENIRASIGPAGTIKRLFQNRDYFYSRGYDMHIFVKYSCGKSPFSRDTEVREMTELPAVSSSIKQKNSWKDKFKAKKHAFVESNQFTSSWAYHRTLYIFSRSIDQYIAMNRTPDIIVFHDDVSCRYYYERRKEKKAKLAMFIHGPGDDDNQFSHRRPKLVGTRDQQYAVETLLKGFKYADVVVWISQNGKRVFLNNHPEYANKTVAVVNGINDMQRVNVVPITEHKYRMVTSGTVCKRKGQYIIIEAMHKMKPEVLKDTHLTILGIGPDYDQLISRCEEYALQEHVTFMGNVPNAEVHQHLCAENIFVLMSRNEGLPISVIEAMRAGLPVISTNVDGIPEQVDERNGVLIDPDINQLTAILNRLPEYDWDTLGLGSRYRFEQEYTFERMLKDYADMFDKLEA